jgi:hypothetical protein
MAATKTKAPRRATKPFKAKVHLTLRYILRFHPDGEFEAECIDAGATGLGETQLEALQDLIINLQALYEFAESDNLKMTAPAHVEDEKLYAKLAARQPVDPTVIGYSLVQCVEMVPTAASKGKSMPKRKGAKDCFSWRLGALA